MNTNGAATSNFTATTGGTVTATLTTVAPDATIAVGLSLGTWTGSACQVVIANDNALQGAIMTGTVTSAASLCVRIYDIGKVTAPVNYTITVVRPSLTGTTDRLRRCQLSGGFGAVRSIRPRLLRAGGSAFGDPLRGSTCG